MPLLAVLSALLRSRTLWGAALTGVSLAAHGLAGMSDADIAGAVQSASDLGAMLGLGLTVVGRLRATTRLPTAPGGPGELAPKREVAADDLPWLRK